MTQTVLLHYQQTKEQPQNKFKEHLSRRTETVFIETAYSCHVLTSTDASRRQRLNNFVGSGFFNDIFIVQTVYTVCTRTNYRIVPVAKFSKYLQHGTVRTEIQVQIAAVKNCEQNKTQLLPVS